MLHTARSRLLTPGIAVESGYLLRRYHQGRGVDLPADSCKKGAEYNLRTEGRGAEPEKININQKAPPLSKWGGRGFVIYNNWRNW